jgi:hypothetical protein
VVANNSLEAGEERKGDFRGSKEVLPSIASPSCSIKAECYRIAREIWSERGASLVAQSFQAGRDDSEVLEIVCEARDAGVDAEELAAALWVPDFNPYRGNWR